MDQFDKLVQVALYVEFAQPQTDVHDFLKTVVPRVIPKACGKMPKKEVAVAKGV